MGEPEVTQKLHSDGYEGRQCKSKSGNRHYSCCNKLRKRKNDIVIQREQ